MTLPMPALPMPALHTLAPHALALHTLALCWRIERRDGIAIGLTAHDRDLVVAGFRYRAAPGMVPSAVARRSSLEADTMEVTGALTAGAISEADLIAGRWDGARVAVLVVDWESGAATGLGGGRLGSVTVKDGGFTAELAGPAAAFDREVAEATSPECRAELGDRRCRVAMAGRRRFARVVAVDDVTVTVDGAEPAANAYGGGVLRWFGGGNAGLASWVAASAGAVLTLRQPPVADAVGALVELVEGCDKRLETCAGRFGNAANFRGEPFLPGMDLLTRYPGA